MTDETNRQREDLPRTNSTATSVWSLCAISGDSDHVDLRDITPSISPVVFTDDQVQQITQQNSDIDVLGTPFIPHETFKQINEVLTSAGQDQSSLLMTCSAPMLVQDAISYSAADLGSAFQHDQNPLKHDHDVLLHSAGDLKLDLPLSNMFPSFDGPGDQRITEETLNMAPERNRGHGVGESLGNLKKEGEDNEEGSDKKSYSLRRSPRKQAQQKVATKKANSKCGNSRAETKGEIPKEPPTVDAEPATRRRSPRTKLDPSKDKEETDLKTAASPRGGRRKADGNQKTEELSKTVRR